MGLFAVLSYMGMMRWVVCCFVVYGYVMGLFIVFYYMGNWVCYGLFTVLYYTGMLWGCLLFCTIWVCYGVVYCFVLYVSITYHYIFTYHLRCDIFQKFYIPTSRQLKRISSLTRSPIYVHFSETVSGASTIRAYGASQRFIEHSEETVDYNLGYVYAAFSSNRLVMVIVIVNLCSTT